MQRATPTSPVTVSYAGGDPPGDTAASSYAAITPASWSSLTFADPINNNAVFDFNQDGLVNTSEDLKSQNGRLTT